MKSTPRLLSFAAVSACVVVSLAEAHPGHSHADIPSVIRHPFSGPEHLLVSGAIGIALGALLLLLTRRAPMPALVRWTSALAVAVGVTLGLSA